MAIRKDEAMKKLTQQDQEDLPRLEAVVDEILLQRWEGYGYVVIDYAPLRRVLDRRPLSPRLIRELKRRYEAAGWSVEETHGEDQRDGDYMKFS